MVYSFVKSKTSKVQITQDKHILSSWNPWYCSVTFQDLEWEPDIKWCMMPPEGLYVKHYQSNDRADTTGTPLFVVNALCCCIPALIKSLQGHWCAGSAVTFVILCSLFPPDRTHRTAHQDPTPQPAAVASNSISSRIKHAPPSPVLWKTSLQGWVWGDFYFYHWYDSLCPAHCLVLNLLLPVIVCCKVPWHSSTLDRERIVIALFQLCISLSFSLLLFLCHCQSGDLVWPTSASATAE